MNNIRILKIVDYVRQKKYCTIDELQKNFKVSSATIHRDITTLASKGILLQMHGGVAFQENTAQYRPHSFSPFQERIEWNKDKKQAIAKLAMQHVKEGDILFLDSSTTTHFFAQLLEKSTFSSLTIITNSVTIIQDFHKFPNHYVLIGLGGGYDIQLNAFLGQTTLREIENLNISKAFISAFGITDEKVTTNHERHAELLLSVLKIAKEKYLLADQSKFGREGLFSIASPAVFKNILNP